MLGSASREIPLHVAVIDDHPFLVLEAPFPEQ